ncbi:MAG TPA: hypothetical protein VHP11_18100 [Tepidisphaeraceae bacterium]|nr:hypothetical protein [Tepidisphaeraceae bacterium]
MVMALGTLGFFSLLENWPELLSLTWRPVLGVGCIFGWLAGTLSTTADSTDECRETISGQA